jgi:Helicase conserved C-terminal domain
MMQSSDAPTWTDHIRRALECYDEALLRQVGAKLVRPRNQWPAEELIERCVQTFGNPVVLDRRLQELEPESRRILAFMARSRRSVWRLGSLLEFIASSGGTADPNAVQPLLDTGLLYPEFKQGKQRLKSFDQWLVLGAGTDYSLVAHPALLDRCLNYEIGLPPCPAAAESPLTVQEADGLDFPLRLAGLWQLLRTAPLRTTQGGEFFKRDFDRLRGDTVLSTPVADGLIELPDPALLTVHLGLKLGVVLEENGEYSAGQLGETWEATPGRWTLALWTALLDQQAWNPRQGGSTSCGPFASAYVLLLLLLAGLPEGAWAKDEDLQDWLHGNHPYWKEEDLRPSERQQWVGKFLLGIAYPLRLVQAARSADGGWLVRLASWGRWLLGLADEPGAAASYPQTLLVQPNLEIIAFRQGLNPALIGRLSRFAQWKSLGAACTLQLDADSIYRGLESGLTFEAILQTLEKHSTRALPPSVVELLRTWSDKRERISVYGSATLLEFGAPEDLNEALARGINGARLSDLLLIVPGELPIESLKHFRVTGNRDWAAPPEKCVEVETDGVTLAVDVARSDLLLETQLQRFAQPLDGVSVHGRRRYLLTPDSLTQARQTGLDFQELDEWFFQRTGHGLPAAGRLLLQRAGPAQLKARRQLVLDTGSEEIADGIMQWPQTRSAVEERLGPTRLALAESEWSRLLGQLRALGLNITEDQVTG